MQEFIFFKKYPFISSKQTSRIQNKFILLSFLSNQADNKL
jgi:hypothetical protein